MMRGIGFLTPETFAMHNNLNSPFWSINVMQNYSKSTDKLHCYFPSLRASSLVSKTFTLQKRSLKLLGVVILAGIVAACDSDNDINPTVPVDKSEIRIIHASPDAPAVNASLTGVQAVSDLDYAQSTGYVTVDAASYDITVEGIVPSGNLEVISVPGFPLSSDARQTVIAVNTLSAISPLVVSDSAGIPRADEVAIRVVHASPTAGSVDAFVTAPAGALTGGVTLNFQGDVDLGAVTAGQYQIRLTAPGNTGAIAYDSGIVDLTPFAGQTLLIMAIDATNQTELAESPVKLLVATDASTNDNGTVILLDVDTQSGAKVVHASPDAASPAAANGPVEVFATINSTSVELIPAFNYTDVAPATNSYVNVDAGSYIFDVAPNTDNINDSVFMSDPIALAAGAEYTVIAAGDVLDTPAFTLLATLDQNRSIASQASVKVVHGAAAVGNVDVYVTPTGDLSVIMIESGNGGAPLLGDFAFGSISDYEAVAPGNYDIRVVSGNTVAINVENFAFTSGTVATVIAIGPDEVDADPAFPGAIVLSN